MAIVLKNCVAYGNGGAGITFNDVPVADGLYQAGVIDASVLQDAARYRWLRDGNAIKPEEAAVSGGNELDELCDEGMVRWPTREAKK